MIPSMTFYKRQNCGNNKNAEHREFLEQWKYSVWYHYAGSMSSHIYSNPYRTYNIKSEMQRMALGGYDVSV